MGDIRLEMTKNRQEVIVGDGSSSNGRIEREAKGLRRYKV